MNKLELNQVLSLTFCVSSVPNILFSYIKSFCAKIVFPTHICNALFNNKYDFPYTPGKVFSDDHNINAKLPLGWQVSEVNNMY
jgi:hypothetical protein